MKTTWTDVVPAYLTSLRAAHRSPGTIRLHQHYLRHLAAYAPRPFVVTAAALAAALAVPSWSAETRKSARSVVVSFYRWAYLHGHLAHDPSAVLPSISVPAGQPRPAPEAVLADALAIARPRERVMMMLAAYTGLRCAEIARTHAEDLVTGLLYVHGKGGKTRIVPLEHPELLAAYAHAAGYLFPGRTAGHLAPGTVSQMLSRALARHWTGHTLRHRFATRAYAGTHDLLGVGRALGHSRPETTQRYVQLPPDTLLAVVRAAA